MRNKTLDNMESQELLHHHPTIEDNILNVDHRHTKSEYCIVDEKFRNLFHRKVDAIKEISDPILGISPEHQKTFKDYFCVTRAVFYRVLRRNTHVDTMKL